MAIRRPFCFLTRAPSTTLWSPWRSVASTTADVLCGTQTPSDWQPLPPCPPQDYRPQRVVVADTASEASAAPAPAPVPASVPTPAPAQAVPDRPGSLAGPSSAGELATAVTSHAVAVMTPLLNPDKASARRLVEAWKQRRMASSTKASSTGATRTSSATESTKPPLRSRPQVRGVCGRNLLWRRFVTCHV